MGEGYLPGARGSGHLDGAKGVAGRQDVAAGGSDRDGNQRLGLLGRNLDGRGQFSDQVPRGRVSRLVVEHDGVRARSQV